MARPGALDVDRPSLHSEHFGDDVGKRNVQMVRTRVVSPTYVQSNTLCRNTCQGAIERIGSHGQARHEVRHRLAKWMAVGTRGQIWSVYLQGESGVDDAPVFVRQRGRGRINVVFKRVVIVIGII